MPNSHSKRNVGESNGLMRSESAKVVQRYRYCTKYTSEMLVELLGISGESMTHQIKTAIY